MKLERGDVVLARPNGLLGLAVVKFQSFFGDPAEFSHVGVVTGGGDTEASNPLLQPIVTEALAYVETEPWGKNWRGRDFVVYRHVTLSEEDKEQIARAALAYTGRPYGWWKLVVIAADAWLSRHFERNMRVFSQLLHVDEAPICSYLVQKAFWLGIEESFGVPVGSAQPDDIGDWCTAQPTYVRVTA